MSFVSPPRHVLCYVDGTPESDVALLAAIELAQCERARLTIAACAPVQRRGCHCGFPVSKWNEIVRECSAADLERAAEEVARVGGEATMIVVGGCGARDLAAAARDRGCDVIVVGARHGWWSWFPRAVRRHARVPVVAVDARGAPLATRQVAHVAR
jgi:nucleotide-binding universal stress UspA family protein